MNCKSAHGFTLVEVLVAMTVAILGTLAVTLPALTAVSNSAKLRDMSLAHWVAMNHATDLRLAGAWPDTGRSDGDVEFANRDWRWVTEISETEVEALRRAEISVSFADDPDREVAHIVAFIGQPTPGMTFRPWTGPVGGNTNPTQNPNQNSNRGNQNRNPRPPSNRDGS